VAEKARSTGTVYRDEAADLMAAAARGHSRQAPPELELTARRVAPDVWPETQRPSAGRSLPYAAPIGLNDNSDDDPGAEVRYAPRVSRRRLSMLQVLARIVIAPFYLLVAIGAVAVIALFAWGFLG
jgi:hypothetical protein